MQSAQSPNAVALVISGDVQGGQGDRDLTDRDEDGDLAGRLGRRRIGPGRYPADAGTKRVVQGALIDVRRVADENDGPAGVLVVAALTKPVGSPANAIGLR